MGAVKFLRLQQSERRAGLVSGEHLFGGPAEMIANEFAQNSSKICCHFEISFFEKLFGLQTWPRAEDLSTAYRTTKDEHYVAMAVVSAVVAGFRGCPAKFRHGHKHDVLHAISHISHEGSQRIAKLVEKSGQLSVLIGVVVPASDIRESGFQASVRLNESRDLPQRISKLADILRSVGRSVRRTVDGIDELHRFEGALPLSHELLVWRRRIHAFQNGCHACVTRLKLLKITNRNRVTVSTKRPWHFRTHRNRTKCRG